MQCLFGRLPMCDSTFIHPRIELFARYLKGDVDGACG